MLICVSPPPRFDRQPSRQGQSYEEKAPKERGKVFVNEDIQPEIWINNIEVTTRSSRSELVVLYGQYVNSPYWYLCISFSTSWENIISHLTVALVGCLLFLHSILACL